MQKTMTIYDYADTPKNIALPYKEISAICVSVLSGDETGEVLFEDGSTLCFDASDCRIVDFYDGGYIVQGAPIDRWINFVPSEGRTSFYDRQKTVDKWKEELGNAT